MIEPKLQASQTRSPHPLAHRTSPQRNEPNQLLALQRIIEKANPDGARFYGFLTLFFVILFTFPIHLFAASGTTLVGQAEPQAAQSEVLLCTPERQVVARTIPDSSGRFTFPSVAPGHYLVLLPHSSGAHRWLAVTVPPSSPDPVILDTSAALPREQITVRAHVGSAEPTALATRGVNAIPAVRLSERVKVVVAQFANEEPGLALQRTSPSLSGVFVRGLTGNKVSVFVDGVRYSTGGARGGINTFFNLVEPRALEAVEVIRGPESAQFGSDALGGTVQFLTRRADASGWHGEVGATGHTADASAGADATLSGATRRIGLVATLASRRVNTLRTGDGIDSRSAATRFLGLPSAVYYGPRVPDTAFTQYSGLVRLQAHLNDRTQTSIQYLRGQQDGGKRPDQLLSGDGNLIADLRNLMVDFGYLRLARQGLGWFDQAQLTLSLNGQREERVNQGGTGDPRASIVHERERLTAKGVQAQASKLFSSRHALLVGGDFYAESLRSPAFGVSPVTGVATLRRPRVPNGATYRHGGAFAQTVSELLARRLRVVLQLRQSAAAYRADASDSPLVNGLPLWPDDRQSNAALTGRGGVAVRVGVGWTVSASVGQGFRAPHITDLGTLGLTGSGFEVAAPDVAGRSALVGTTAGADAVPTGELVRQLRPESALAVEAGTAFRSRTLEWDAWLFQTNVADNIAKQSLILPAGAVGQTLGGQPIVAQNGNGVVFVGLSPNPVLVRTNFDNARIWGLEQQVLWRPARAWEAHANFTYIRAEDTATGLSPNIEGGTPAPAGSVRMRHQLNRTRVWIEPVFQFAWRQDRLSSLDAGDRRTGAGRSADSIARFFRNGAVARNWVGAGPDSRIGTVDDRLLATGEMLPEVQARVLRGASGTLPLFPAVPGYGLLHLRLGWSLGERTRLFVEAENLLDRNYRGVSWGMDGAGRGLFVRYQTAF